MAQSSQLDSIFNLCERTAISKNVTNDQTTWVWHLLEVSFTTGTSSEVK